MSFKQSNKQIQNNYSLKEQSPTHPKIQYNNDNFVVKQINYSKKWDKQDLKESLEAQNKLAKEHTFVLKIIGYKFISNTTPSKQLCIITYNGSKNSKSLLKILENLSDYSLNQRLEIFEKLKQIKKSLVDLSIIHGNLKPSNVIFDNKQIYLTDFRLQMPKIQTDFSEKQNYYPYLSIQVLEELQLQQIQPNMLQMLDFKKQDQYAIEVMMLQLFAKFNFHTDLDSLGDWIQEIKQWKNEIKGKKFILENMENEYDFIEEIKLFTIFQEDIKSGPGNENNQYVNHNLTNVLNTPNYQLLNQHSRVQSVLSNEIKDFSFINYFKWYSQQENKDYYNKVNFERINIVQQLDDTKHCLIEDGKIFIGKFQYIIFNKQYYFSEGEVIENSQTNINIVKHYKNVQKIQNELCGDDCEIIWWSISQQNQFQKQQYYKGQLKNSKQDGQGEFIMYHFQIIRQIYYQGQWHNGKMSGQGVQQIQYEDDKQAKNQILKYEGDFENGKYNGIGKAYYDRLYQQYHQGKYVQGQPVGEHLIFFNNILIKKRVYHKFLCWNYCLESDP